MEFGRPGDRCLVAEDGRGDERAGPDPHSRTHADACTHAGAHPHTDADRPSPTPTPTPSPQPTPVPEPRGFDQTGRQAPPPAAAVPTSSLAETPLALLRPFPVVRVKGTLVRGGARITLLRVKAPSSATVDVRCDGPGCRVRRRLFGTGRLTALERFLPAGTRITIRVFKADVVGKYMRLVIRDGSAPWRRDACVVARSAKPAECPEA